MILEAHLGDCLDVIPRLVAEGRIVDAVVCDPPYHLVAMTKRFGTGAPAHSPDHQRFAKGFLGTEWDGGDIAFQASTWATIAQILRPGGFLLAFGSPRTSHRLACAIEDSGLVLQDTLLFLHGQGFPKRRDMLKPGYEPIIMAYRPGGPRSLQVDECRVPLNDDEMVAKREGEPSQDERYGERGYSVKPGRRIGLASWGGPMKRLSGAPGQEGRLVPRVEPAPGGRWPTNLLIDDSAEVAGMFAAYGTRSSGTGAVKKATAVGHQGHVYGTENRPVGTPNVEYGDSGSASRFYYCVKARKHDRFGSEHPTIKSIELFTYLVRLVCPTGGTFIDPFAGSGVAAAAAAASGRNAILIEKEPRYFSDIEARIAHLEGRAGHSVSSKGRHVPKDKAAGAELPLFKTETE